jgi:hypothetical protein
VIRRFSTFFYGVAVLALADCHFSASPTEGLRFAPPPDWRASPGMLGYVQFWRPPSGVREALMLFKSPKRLTAGDVFSDANMQGSFKSVTVQRKSEIEICGSQPALLVQGIAISRDDRLSNVEMVMSDVRGTSYLAMYLRPVEEPPNTTAEAALRELCAKS